MDRKVNLKERRWKRIDMTPESAVLGCVTGNMPLCIEGIPDTNYKVVGILIDKETQILTFYIEHDSFGKVPEGACIPELTPTFTTRYEDRIKAATRRD